MSVKKNTSLVIIKRFCRCTSCYQQNLDVEGTYIIIVMGIVMIIVVIIVSVPVISTERTESC